MSETRVFFNALSTNHEHTAAFEEVEGVDKLYAIEYAPGAYIIGCSGTGMDMNAFGQTCKQALEDYKRAELLLRDVDIETWWSLPSDSTTPLTPQEQDG